VLFLCFCSIGFSIVTKIRPFLKMLTVPKDSDVTMEMACVMRCHAGCPNFASIPLTI
jgi:hypothetical protein